MTPESLESETTLLRVIDALDHPYEGRILRLRLEAGAPPRVRALRGATLHARSPDGEESQVTVLGFPVMGGKPSDARIRETGRIDLQVVPLVGDPPPQVNWRVALS